MAHDIDLIVIGGGIAGSALAAVMARAGVKTLVLESDRTFRDRVRGEAIMPWGVAEVEALGLQGVVEGNGANPLTHWDSYQGAERSGHRDLVRTTKAGQPVMACYHPTLQEALIQHAADSGAAVWRGVKVRGLTSGRDTPSPTVHFEKDGTPSVLAARMVVGADGRGSLTRSWGGFSVNQDPQRNLVSGVLMEGVELEKDATHAWLNTDRGQFVLNFPHGQGRARVYLCYDANSARRFSGAKDVDVVIAECVASGVPSEVYEHATAAGPLATFEGRSVWVQTPYRYGIALIGDAAANTDPTWGQGLSMGLRDARVLTEKLLSTDNWDAAGMEYVKERDQYFSVVHAMENWQTQLLMDTGPDADATRTRAMASWRSDRTRNPDTFLSGPGPSLGEPERRRYFGED